LLGIIISAIVLLVAASNYPGSMFINKEISGSGNPFGLWTVGGMLFLSSPSLLY